MSGFEFNKIFAGIIIAVIVLIIIDQLGDMLVNPNTQLQETAYKIDIKEKEDSRLALETNDSLNIDNISSLLASASLENGEKIYNKCGSCHNYQKNSKSKIGPNLWNIVNRSKGNVEGFAYSNSIIEFGGKWTYEELNKFLYKPKEYIQGTKMNFVGLKNENDRADLILWLRQNSENPIALP